MSGGLSHRRPTTIVDQVPPQSIRAAGEHGPASWGEESPYIAVVKKNKPLLYAGIKIARRRQDTATGKTTRETVYAITSLASAQPHQRRRHRSGHHPAETLHLHGLD